MKTFFKLFSIAAITMTMVFASCGPDTPEKPEKPKTEEPKPDETISVPTNLNAEVAGYSAALSWNGNGNTFEVEVNGKKHTVTGKTDTVVFENNGTYTWKVRTVQGNSFSKWAESSVKIDVVTTLNKTEGLTAQFTTAFSAIFRFRKTSDATHYEVKIGDNITTVEKLSTDRKSVV